MNEQTVFTYDASNRLSSVSRPSGLLTTNIYGSDNFLATKIDVGFATNSFTWSNDLVLTHMDSRGLTITNAWDNLQRPLKISYPDGTFITNSYDRLDLVRTVDRMGFTNSWGYDSMRHNTSITNALGNVTLLDYCSCGSLNWTHDAQLNYTYFYYDNAGQMTNSVGSDGYGVTNFYNLLGQLTNVVDNAGAKVTNWFNNQGLQIAVSNAFGQVQATTYDILDRATNSVDANGVSIAATYDNLDRGLTRSYPDSGVEKWGYTANFSEATSYTNQLNQVTLYGYDAALRKIAETNANLEITRFTYSGANDLLTLTDGKSQTTTWIYDSYGRASNKVDAAGNLLFVYKYDSNDRLTNRWTVAKGDTKYAYDAVGNLANIDYAVSPDITFQYDSLNRLTNMSDAVGATKLSYNAVGQLLSEDGPWSNDTLSYTYANRLRSTMSLLQPSASDWTQSYGYDVTKRMTNVTSSAGSFVYAYDSARPLQVKKLTLPNSAYITNTFDENARLLGTALKNSSQSTLNSHFYQLNVGNQRTVLTNTAGDYRNYTYDGAGQLKTAFGYESGGTARLNEKLGYLYDASGNLNQRTNNALVQTFNVNSLNELTTATRSGTLIVAGTTTSAATNVTVNTQTASRYSDNTFAKDGFTIANGNNSFTAIAEDGYGRKDTNSITVNLPATVTFVYDLNGNLTSDGKRGLEYDDENQLVRVTVTNEFKKEFVYDGLNRLRIKREYQWTGSWTQTNGVRFIYDGNLTVQHRDANNLPTLSLTRGNDLSGSLQGAGGIGGLLALSQQSTIIPQHFYYHSDGNGNVTALVNTNQIVVARHMYDSFGITLSLSGTKADANPYWFSSQLYDADTDFYHYQRRVYVPAWQRFLNRDPIEEMGGINLFGFVDNGPINRIDPFGLREDNEHDWLAPSYAYTHPAIPLNTEPRPTLILYPNNFVGSLPPNAMYQWAYEAEGTGIHEDGAGYLLVPGGGLYGRLTSSGAKLCAAKATAPIEKFSHYLFKEGATHGKDKVFRSLGYNAKDSAQLAKLWEKQASAKYAQGNYTLGKLNQYGQHINITIDVPGVGVAAGKTRSVTSGWMINVCETKFRWFVVSRLFFA